MDRYLDMEAKVCEDGRRLRSQRPRKEEIWYMWMWLNLFQLLEIVWQWTNHNDEHACATQTYNAYIIIICTNTNMHASWSIQISKIHYFDVIILLLMIYILLYEYEYASIDVRAHGPHETPYSIIIVIIYVMMHISMIYIYTEYRVKIFI